MILSLAGRSGIVTANSAHQSIAHAQD